MGTWDLILFYAFRLVSLQRYSSTYQGHDMKADIHRKCNPYFNLTTVVSKKEKLK